MGIQPHLASQEVMLELRSEVKEARAGWEDQTT